MSDTITFTRKDDVPNYIYDSLVIIANHFKIQRKYLVDFCSMILISNRWTISTIDQNLREWKAIFNNVAEDRSVITQLVIDSFKKCQTDEDIKNLRGHLVEALVIGIYGGMKFFQKFNSGWGAHVILKDESDNPFELRYICNIDAPLENNIACNSGKTRETVDFGFWTGKRGKFFECKTQPGGVGCIEIKYMEKLSESLSKRDIRHDIYFVFATSRPNFRQSIAGLGERGKDFNFLSIFELQKNKQAW